ncbi:MAG: phosphatidylserine decarboxylase [Bdellovibrionaceae bacterium]|nr:phosphatidylserine decarboxylase [Bdellovibrionales bacterium]MCB9083747.1 phosphatidylserine decarboxylase [Pseudobdellovibrionaceae bacterium]
MSLKEILLGYLLYLVPKNLMSYWVGRLTCLKMPGILGPALVAWFARRYKLNMDEAEFPLEAYPSINQLFTRRLKPGARPLGEGVVHPADSCLTQRGEIILGSLYQIKGWGYSAQELLAESDVSHWEHGHYLTYYLCPTDYHRVHSPVAGKVVRITHIPGALWPVNLWSVHNIPHLFARNERLIFYIDTALGRVALVMVGATNVGKMTLCFDSDWVTNQPNQREIRRKDMEPAFEVQKGEELGIFNMGSTVVMLYPPGFLDSFPEDGGVEIPVRMGESLFPTSH